MTIDNEMSSAPDPVAERAAKFAVEATDTTVPHPIRGKLAVLFLVLFIVIGTYGSIIGTINTFDLKHQNSLLRGQQKCQTQLLQAITEEQNARANIAADDRQAQKDFNTAIAQAKNAKERDAARKEYNRELAVNEQRREKYPVPTFQNNVCDTKAGQTSVDNNHKNQSVAPSSTNGNQTDTNSTSPKSGSTQSSSRNNTSKNKMTPTNIPHSLPTLNKTHSNGVTSPPQPAQSSGSKSTKSATSQPILNIPNCTVSVLGQRVC